MENKEKREWENDTELFDMMQEHLYAAVISDALDTTGFREQAMQHTIRPLLPETVVVGRAMPVLCLDVYEVPDEPYQQEIAAVDSLKQDDVLVCSTNGSTRICFWGELLSTAARARGARGAVIEGFIRDVRKIMQMQFPIFTTGITPVDSNGRGEVVAYNAPIECGGVTVNPGDIVFGDADGVVVIPQSVETQVIEAALEKVSAENRTRDALREGATLREVYDEFGIL
ncbi:RraA family protein [Candidatus Poribacteria bacterium]|nr:RraA family protein [Candidatus Poribacteria bacterium]MYB66161.1 RraA family protein [Candidatus Poribacteria bacterium]MYF56159.1 RraA family protein [Candidatus Poribacteria bacterium]MYI92891.1 RraA family protein [Candidatus Poribacteria bacterium]